MVGSRYGRLDGAPDDGDTARSKPLVTWVVVLGDFGRSPRMQYHTMSLASHSRSQVHVLAYGGSTPLSVLTSAPNVHLHTLPEPPKLLQRLPRTLLLVLKVLHQLFWLAWAMLVTLPSPRSILLQNPPAIPTMATCWVASKWHRATLVIDWHNFGYTILALGQRRRRSTLLRWAERHERYWGAARGARHLCVTAAMKEELDDGWGIDATVLYDRPPAFFQRTDPATARALFTRLEPALAAARYDDWLAPILRRPDLTAALAGRSPGGTLRAQDSPASAPPPAPAGRLAALLTSVSPAADSPVTWRSDRPAIVVSSTSWTPDEDFGILYEATLLYEALAAMNPALPRLLLLITGRGPERALYEARLATMALHAVAVRTVWLEPEDYPLLLGAADVGVSLHSSSSGLDLPMKVVDMFGSGLPVCALAYSCIGELVESAETGLLFSSPEQLAGSLARLLTGFPAAPSTLLRHMQRQVADKQQARRWEENWDAVAWPLLGGTQARG